MRNERLSIHERNKHFYDFTRAHEGDALATRKALPRVERTAENHSATPPFEKR
jgi:hypothetical protein